MRRFRDRKFALSSWGKPLGPGRQGGRHREVRRQPSLTDVMIMTRLNVTMRDMRPPVELEVPSSDHVNGRTKSRMTRLTKAKR